VSVKALLLPEQQTHSRYPPTAPPKVYIAATPPPSAAQRTACNSWAINLSPFT